MGAQVRHSAGWIRQTPGAIIKRAIRLYQRAISPVLPRACRFHPSCSEYMYQAVARYGALQGGYLGVRRLLRCHPWNPGGVDPVP